MVRRTVAIIAVLLSIIPAVAGTWTTNGFIYKPALGARGTTEKDTYDTGQDRLDARLGKQVFIGDPNYGTTLAAAITAIGSSKVTLVVPPGTWTGDDLTIPATMGLRVLKGATITVSDGATLTINGPLSAGPYQVFTCTGTGKVVFGAGSVREAYPEWFGCTVAGSGVDNAAALQKLVDALTPTDMTHGGVVRFGGGTYTITGPITVNGGLQFKGLNQNTSIIYNNDTSGNNLFDLVNSRDATAPAPFFMTFEDLQIKGNGSSGEGIYAVAPFYLFINRCYIQNHGKRGINLILGSSPYAWGEEIFIENSRIDGNQLGGIRLSGDIYNIHISNCTFNTDGYYGVYAAGITGLEINNCVFGGFNFGRPGIPAVQHYPIVLNGGQLVTVSQCEFEGCGGDVGGGHIGSCVRTGFNGDTQADVTNNTQAIRIEKNDFIGVSTLSGDIDYIHLNYAMAVTITGNSFNKGTGYTGTVNGVYFADGMASQKFAFLNNHWDSNLDARITGQSANNAAFLWLDQSDPSVTEKAYVIGVNAGTDEQTAFYTKRYDQSGNRLAISTYGKLSWGDGTNPASVELSRSNNTGGLKLTGNCPTYTDNAAALAAGLTAGDIYRTSTGQLMIVYTP